MTFGVESGELFTVPDLHSAKYLNGVVENIYAVNRCLQMRGYKGSTIGAKFYKSKEDKEKLKEKKERMRKLQRRKTEIEEKKQSLRLRQLEMEQKSRMVSCFFDGRGN